MKPEEWRSFDIVHTRFLLEHVQDPVAVVRMMTKAVRPGGRIILQDDDHDVLRIYPDIPGFNELWAAYMKTYENVGNDPRVGRRLVQLLHQAGVNPGRNHWLFFGSCAGHPHFQHYVRNLLGVIATGKEAMLSANLLTATEYDRVIHSFAEWEQRADASLWYAVCWAEGTRP